MISSDIKRGAGLWPWIGAGGSPILLESFEEGALVAGLALRKQIHHAGLAQWVHLRGFAEFLGLDALPAEHLPTGEGHLVDQTVLLGVLGLERLVEVAADLAQLVEVSDGQSVGLGAQAVAKGVEAREGLTRFGAGAGRFQSIATIGRDLFFGCHRYHFSTNEANKTLLYLHLQKWTKPIPAPVWTRRKQPVQRGGGGFFGGPVEDDAA
jgi:hypothetical protein